MNNSLGVISAGHDEAVSAGEEILRAGGNAYDAALAALSAACVVEPVLASFAGGGFMLTSPKDKDPIVYDFFVQTPGQKKSEEELDFQSIMANFGSSQQEFHIGMASAAVPGQILGMFQIHKDLCSMSMKEIFEPAIRLARDGVAVNAYQACLFLIVEDIFLTGEDLKERFSSKKEPGKLVLEGEIVKRPALADFLEVLSIEGSDLFYRGEIAKTIDRDMKNGGLITAQDLERYQVVKRKPLTMKYRDVHIEMNPSPSSGGLLVALGLKLFEDIDLTNVKPASQEYLMHLANVLSQTLEARIAVEAMDDEKRQECIFDEEFMTCYREGVLSKAKARRGTTHISVIDKDGNMAGVTVSNGEGSHYVIPGSGIIMNNMMGEEDLNPAGFHNWTPNTRMSSMMNPTALLWPCGRRLSLGSGGSNRIRSAILQLILNLVDFDMNALEAVDLPRIHQEINQLYVEGGFSEDISALLRAYPDHTVFDDYSMFFGGTHLAEFDGQSFQGAGDPRRSGVCKVL